MIHANSVKAICPSCNQEFATSLSRVKKSKVHCCSKDCADLLKKAGVRFNAQCKNCKKDIHVKPSVLKKRPGRVTCSIECAEIVKNTSKGQKAECTYCKKVIYKEPSVLKNNKTVCCSIECKNLLQKSELFKLYHPHKYEKGEFNKKHISDFSVSAAGYLMVAAFQHPSRNGNNKMCFHRLVMEQYLKEIEDYDNLVYKDDFLVLDPCLIVHHKDENKFNNCISNLQLMTNAEHTLHHCNERYKQSSGKFITGKIVSGKLSKYRSLDAGQDIFSNEDVVINPGDSKLVSTGLFIEIPDYHVGLIWSKSGLSVKNKIEVGAGCIDVGYTGEVKVHLYNLGKDWFKIFKGDRIAQLLTIPINLNSYEGSEVDEENQARGSNGFGSTGTR
jgi:dUTP pyrophosphatase